MGFYDLLNQKLNRVSSSEINYRSDDEEPCDYPFGSCVCGASETDGAVTCVCCATGSGSGSGSGSEGHGPGYWRKALAADSKTALGVVTVLGISAASPAGSVLAGAAAASTPAILASAGVTIGVSSLYGGLFN